MKKEKKILIDIVVVLLVILVGIVVGILLFPKKEYKENNQNNNSQSVVEEEKQVEQNNSQTVEENTYYLLDSTINALNNIDFNVSNTSFISSIGIIKGKKIIQYIEFGSNDGPLQPSIYLTDNGEAYYVPFGCNIIEETTNGLIEKTIEECKLDNIKKLNFDKKIIAIASVVSSFNSEHSSYNKVLYKAQDNKIYTYDLDTDRSSEIFSLEIISDFIYLISDKNEYDYKLKCYTNGDVYYDGVKQSFKIEHILFKDDQLNDNYAYYIKDLNSDNWYVIDKNGVSLYNESIYLKDGNVYSNNVKIGYYS